MRIENVLPSTLPIPPLASANKTALAVSTLALLTLSANAQPDVGGLDGCWSEEARRNLGGLLIMLPALGPFTLMGGIGFILGGLSGGAKGDMPWPLRPVFAGFGAALLAGTLAIAPLKIWQETVCSDRLVSH